jgi:hypothetical protein
MNQSTRYGIAAATATLVVFFSGFGIAATQPASPGTPAKAQALYETPYIAAERQLLEAAEKHGVHVRRGEAVYAGDAQLAIAAVAIAGTEKFRPADFVRPVPVHLVIIRSRTATDVPDGSYVVKFQIRPGATEGIAIFTGPDGYVVARHRLFVRTPAQAAAIFPWIYNDPHPVSIPVVTSTHVWHDGHWAIDCYSKFYNVTYYY